MALVLFTVVAVVSGRRTAESKQPAPQPLPVKTETVNLAPVPRQDEYCRDHQVAALRQHPAAGGRHLTKILVKSGDTCEGRTAADDHRSAEAGGSCRSAAQHRSPDKATYEYNQSELQRQKKLYEDGVASKQAYELAVQAYENSKLHGKRPRSASVTQAARACLLQLDGPV